MTEFEIFFSGGIFYNQRLYFTRKKCLSICSDKCKKVYVSMYEIIFDRNGAKAYIKKSTSSLSEKNPRNVILWNLLVVPAQQVVAYTTVCTAMLFHVFCCFPCVLHCAQLGECTLAEFCHSNNKAKSSLPSLWLRGNYSFFYFLIYSVEK